MGVLATNEHAVLDPHRPPPEAELIPLHCPRWSVVHDIHSKDAIERRIDRPAFGWCGRVEKDGIGDI